MDTVFWIILIVAIVGVVWWLLNRKSTAKSPGRPAGTDAPRSDGALSGGSAAASAEAAGTTGIATAAGFGRPAEPAVPTTADEPAESSASVEAPRPERTGSGSSVASSADAAGPDVDTPTGSSGDDRRRQDQTEWETQWSEAGGGSSARPSEAPAAPREQVAQAAGVQAPDTAADAAPVHHPEYTAPQAPTLPGAETAAVEEGDDDGTAAPSATPATPATSQTPARAQAAGAAGGPVPSGAAAVETQDRAQSSALVEAGADHRTEGGAGTGRHPAEASGHLAADEPYGAGSAAAGADGSGPADYGVKGDAGGMVYYEEGHPDYGQTRADVWFESPAHAEAAGFQAPRRKRL
ncbi:hypothetical protein [Pseudarthrobacter sp. NS4]|uniref:sunset domain-containing protein n=1 Tax=Pseudarthrobacter sp. NS4 TaxID=2973976 RepID=UPI0021630833|nr:hypothetical protein [Pseudarthrobacter sp. NS4]